jgi:hypothetical protein
MSNLANATFWAYLIVAGVRVQFEMWKFKRTRP